MFFHAVEHTLCHVFLCVVVLLCKSVKIKICRTIILPVVLYGCESWSLTMREELG